MALGTAWITIGVFYFGLGILLILDGYLSLLGFADVLIGVGCMCAGQRCIDKWEGGENGKTNSRE